MKTIGVTELCQRAAKVIHPVRRRIKRARFIREVRRAESEYATGSLAEFQDVEALIAHLKT